MGMHDWTVSYLAHGQCCFFLSLHSRMSKINHHRHQSILILLKMWCDMLLHLLVRQMCEKNALWGLEFTKHRPPLGLQVAPFPSPALLSPQAVCSISGIQLMLELYQLSGVDLRSLEALLYLSCGRVRLTEGEMWCIPRVVVGVLCNADSCI